MDLSGGASSATDEEQLLRALPRRGLRFALIGGAIGLALGLGGVLGLGALVDAVRPAALHGFSGSDALRAIGLVALLALGGAGVALSIAAVPVAWRFREALGDGPQARARRRHVLRGDPMPPDWDDAAALAWARVASAYTPYRVVSLVGLWILTLAVRILLLDRPGEPAGLVALFIGVLALALAVVVVIQLRDGARARRYVAAHTA